MRNSDGSFKRSVTLRYTKKVCQTFQSIPKGNQFFSYTDLNGRSNHTVVDWYNLCRDVVVYCFSRRQKMGGRGCIVEIDESLFQGKRKYNRGLLLCSDQRTGNEENEEPLNNDKTEKSAEETN
ncbi:Uncharacterized protein FWK35_00022339 [Aphis craccivora]|uniref:Uncharacterized protein n=1 Tax=Aphis craccivora TaxID=307492 RepID=A0A6G0W245_APHCR|nr:Uncharacterized protein FWK35_00022339 [Aphis craccivora]